MTMRRRITGVVVLPMVLAGLLAACGPTGPRDAALTPVGRAVLVGPIPPDVVEGVDPGTLPMTPAVDECVPLARPAATMTICWQGQRMPNEADPAHDYYRLRVFATFGTSARWAAVRARVIGQPSNNVFETWPHGVIEGPCRELPVEGPFGALEEETLCGRTTSSTEGEWDQRVTWECAGCTDGDQASRSVALRQWIAVPARTVPTWEIFADLGR